MAFLGMFWRFFPLFDSELPAAIKAAKPGLTWLNGSMIGTWGTGACNTVKMPPNITNQMSQSLRYETTSKRPFISITDK